MTQGFSGGYNHSGEIISAKEFGTNGNLYNATVVFSVGDVVGFQLEFIEGNGILSVIKGGVKLLGQVSNKFN